MPHLPQRARRAAFLDDILRLRTLYGRRGPRDGAPGILPDGRVGIPERWSVRAVVADAARTLELADPDLARWRHMMGLEDPPAQPAPPVRRKWTDDCPSRGAGLSHAHWSDCKPAAGGHPGTGTVHLYTQCCHCGETI